MSIPATPGQGAGCPIVIGAVLLGLLSVVGVVSQIVHWVVS